MSTPSRNKIYEYDNASYFKENIKKSNPGLMQKLLEKNLGF